MSFKIALSDLAAVVVTPSITNNNLLAWHAGRLLAPIIIFRDTNDAWQLRDGADLLEFARANNWLSIVADDDS